MMPSTPTPKPAAGDERDQAWLSHGPATGLKRTGGVGFVGTFPEMVKFSHPPPVCSSVIREPCERKTTYSSDASSRGGRSRAGNDAGFADATRSTSWSRRQFSRRGPPSTQRPSAKRSDTVITFLDGPASEARLSLRRAPILLRVVIDQAGTVDALDQLTDTPAPTETIHVYRIVPGSLIRAIVCSRGRGCRHESTAQYQLHENQPADEDARDTAKWQAWCETQRHLFEAAADAGMVDVVPPATSPRS